MNDINDIKSIENIFKPNRQCIINTDLDGLLSGMLLKHFLNWEIIGFSCCNGKNTDALWLKHKNINLNNCVFIDLPVCVKNFFVIDQHFVSFDKLMNQKFKEDINKINPNIIREKIFKDITNKNHYVEKYPFGTFHFILAILEHLNIIDNSYTINLKKTIDKFDLADLILRADRVIGNTFSYTPNCFDWSDWIMKIGKDNTNRLFEIVKKEYLIRKNKEFFVEDELKSIGCIGGDGDCSNMFRNKNYTQIKSYFSFLSNAMNLESLPVFEFYDFDILNGKRYEINKYNFEELRNEVNKNNMFSYAFVTMKTLSVTYLKENDDNDNEQYNTINKTTKRNNE